MTFGPELKETGHEEEDCDNICPKGELKILLFEVESIVSNLQIIM